MCTNKCTYITLLTVYFIIQSIKMVQSVHLSFKVVAVIIATMVGVLGQFPDYFDPVRAIQAPPRRRQTNNGQSELYRYHWTT